MNKSLLAIAALLLCARVAAATGEAAAPAAGSPVPAPKDEAAPAAKPSAAAEPRAEANWQSLFVENGRRVEIDSNSIKQLAPGKIQAYGRFVFDRPLPDAMSGGTYQVIEALNTFDCDKRTFITHRRTFRKDESQLLRDESSQRNTDLPVRSGSLDEKLLRAACRPGATDNKASFATTVAQAKAAANGEPVDTRKELQRHDLSSGNAKPVSYKPPASGASPRPKTASRPAGTARTAAPQSAPPAEAAVEWSYSGAGGPDNWARLKPENKLCGSGTRQSPIDIRDGIGVDLPPIKFSYRPSLFRIIDTGRTIQAAVGDNRINLLGKDYELIQLHFHRPGEERINGRGFAMTVHLVHRAADGQLAIVAVPIERGSEHPLVQTLWNYLPLEPLVDVQPPGVAIDLNQLLPEARGYYTYMGSLTTPPCSEGVQWLVMQSPIQLSAEQIDIFARLYPHNVRPIQPPHGRLIKASR